MSFFLYSQLFNIKEILEIALELFIKGDYDSHILKLFPKFQPE